jgi:hypothetical protein
VKNAAIAILLIAIGVVQAKESKPDSHKFIVRMSEGWTTLHPTAGPINLSNCLVVLPDGHMHLELRRQEFLDGHAILSTYEGVLTGDQMQALQRLLEASSVEKLNHFVLPTTPFAAEEWEEFTAEIPRDSDLQKVGSFAWKGKGPENPEVDKTAWREASIALQPLRDWFRAAKTYKSSSWRLVKNADDVCGE